jgi:nitrate/nitrite-specific signal transduction histidine kinase
VTTQERESGSHPASDWDLSHLKGIALFVPLVALAAIELVRWFIFRSFFDSFPGILVLVVLILTGTVLFSISIFRPVETMQARLTQQNQELFALHEAGLAVTSALDLQIVLQNVVDQARELVGARYGALALIDEHDHVEAFLTSGMSAEIRSRLGEIPQGHGLLDVVLKEPKPLRLRELSDDARSVGFPPGHPVMHSLLAVPIMSHGRVLGGLYLTERHAQPEFDLADQQRMERFATQAALAIENAHLHQQVRALAIAEERDRIAREMHDSIAQVLGYVNTKGQAAQELLNAGNVERAEEQIAQLSAAARQAYADVRENILGLRISPANSSSFVDTLGSYLATWQDQSGIVTQYDVAGAAEIEQNLSPLSELQLLRIVQEALSNVRKHAKANRVTISIRCAGESIEVRVSDNGAGFDPNAPSHSGLPQFGLSIMRERAESVGGSLGVESSHDGGTSVTVTIPTQFRGQPVDKDDHAHTHR